MFFLLEEGHFWGGERGSAARKKGGGGVPTRRGTRDMAIRSFQGYPSKEGPWGAGVTMGIVEGEEPIGTAGHM